MIFSRSRGGGGYERCWRACGMVEKLLITSFEERLERG